MVVAIIVVTNPPSLEFTNVPPTKTFLQLTPWSIRRIVPRLVQSFRSSASEASRLLVMYQYQCERVPTSGCCTPCSNESRQHVGTMQVYLSGTRQIGPEILELDEIDFIGWAIFLSEAGTTFTILTCTRAFGADYAIIFR
jgi:hypothetical protein